MERKSKGAIPPTLTNSNSGCKDGKIDDGGEDVDNADNTRKH